MFGWAYYLLEYSISSISLNPHHIKEAEWNNNLAYSKPLQSLGIRDPVQNFNLLIDYRSEYKYSNGIIIIVRTCSATNTYKRFNLNLLILKNLLGKKFEQTYYSVVEVNQ